MGNLRRRRSIAIRPTGVPYHTFNAIIVPTSLRAAHPNMLPTKLLIPMTWRGAEGLRRGLEQCGENGTPSITKRDDAAGDRNYRDG